MERAMGANVDWIRRGLQKPGKTQRGLADAMGIDPSGVSRILAGTRQIKLRDLDAVVRYLEEEPPTNLALSRAMTSPPSEARRAGVRIPATTELAPNLPVYGIAMGGKGSDGKFYFNGSTVDYVRRPPGVALTSGVFGIYVQGTSMEPRYEEGELIVVNPGRPAKYGDYALIELFPPAEDGEVIESGPAFIKRLVRKTATEVVCEQFNPPGEVRYPLEQVRHIYRIMSNSELFGAG